MERYSDREISGILRNIPIFQGLEKADYGEIIPLLRLEKYPPGARIIREGARGDSMCIIIRGTVKVTKADEAGGEAHIETLYPGSYFGEFALVDNMPRSASIIGVEDTEVFRLEKKDFDSLLARNPAISNTFYKNCLEVTFSRFRNTISNFAFTQGDLRVKSTRLDELDRDLSEARKIQSYFINRELLDYEHPFLPGVRHSYIYKPCIEIGGDFLNVTVLRPDIAAIIIADIMGHGITSALGTGVLRGACSLAMEKLGGKPTRFMKYLSSHFMKVIPQLYATCYYALLDMKRKRVKFSKAGHPHPLFWKKSGGDLVDIDCQGTGLGLIKKAEFGEAEYDIAPGDKILLYTDGIIEQQNEEGEEFSEKRLSERFRELAARGEEKIVAVLYEDVTRFAGKTPIADDMTLFLLEF